MTMDEARFRELFLKTVNNRDNPFHPLVWIHGEPKIGRNVYIGGFSEVNAQGSSVTIGDGCDIASFVAINVADSHRKCLGLSGDIERRPIVIEDHVFIGSHSVVKGGAHIGHHSVVAAGTVVEGAEIPPFSLVVGNPMIVKPGYYRRPPDTSPTVPHNRPTLDEGDVAAVSRVLRSASIAQGAEVRFFEQELATRFGKPGWDGVAVSSGTAALYLALKALGVGVGDRVIVPSYVCTALLHAISMAGAEAHVGDIRDSDFNLDAAKVARIPGLKAVILPHTYGVPSDPAELAHLGAPVIEDGAQAIGARWNGRPVGSLGSLAMFSFYATKPLTCGHGGMVLGPEDACKEIRDLRDYDGKRELRPRFNFQMTDFQAALGRSQLRRFDEFLDRRRETASMYMASLPSSLGRQSPSSAAEPNNFRFVIRLERVAEARERFSRAGITTIVPTEPWELLHRQMRLPADGFPIAETVARTTLSLPIHPSLTDEARQRVAAVLESLEDLQ